MTTPSPSEVAVRELAVQPAPYTWMLLLAMSCVHLAGMVSGQGRLGFMSSLLAERPRWLRIAMGGQAAELVDAGQIWRLATSVWVHADALHLLLNLVGLLALGSILEPWIGGRRLLGWFALGGVGASLASHLSGVAQSDGASGGAFAWLGAAIVMGWRWREELDPRDARIMGPGLWTVTAANVLLSLFVPRIDAVAHIAGLLVGVLLGVWVGPGVQERGVFAGAFLLVCLWGWTIAAS